MRKILLPTLVVLPVLLAGCSWGIKLNAAGRKVRTAWLDNVSSCKQLGKITVSVMDHIGPINRNGIKVRDELEVMARNQAATMGADTVKPLGQPMGGEQTWGAYQCGNQTLPPANATSVKKTPTPDGVKTYPMKTGG